MTPHDESGNCAVCDTVSHISFQVLIDLEAIVADCSPVHSRLELLCSGTCQRCQKPDGCQPLQGLNASRVPKEVLGVLLKSADK